MRQSILLPYADANPIQVFLDTIAAIHYDGATTVELTIVGNPTPLAIPVTDADDASAMLLQMNLAFGSQTTATITIPGNPAAGATPTGLAAVNEYGEVNLTWTPVASNYTYNIYRSTVSGSGYTLIGSSSSPSYSDFTNAIGTTYYYVVTTVSERGESAISSEVNGTTLIPDTPTGLAVTPGYNSNVLTWDAITGDAAFPDASYTVYQDGIPIGNFPAVLTTEVTGLDATHNYSYQISATLNIVEGAQSGAVTGMPIALLAPSATACTPGVYQNNVSWSAVVGAQSYNIYRGTSSGSETLLAFGVTDLFLVDSGLRDDTLYYYKVVAFANAVEGPQSSEVSGQPTNATFASYSPDPMTVVGGTLTFTGTDFDPSQAGVITSTETGDMGCSYIDANNLSVNVPGGVPAGNVQFYYLVGGSSYTLPFLVAFS